MGPENVVYWPSTRPNMPFQRRGSCIFHWRRRAWLTIWDKIKSHGTVIDWCTEREWPVNSMTVISAWWQSNMPFQNTAEVTHSDGSYGKKSRRRAWLTIWDKGKIPRYSHRLMHRKRVTCELHYSYFRLMTIKHAIPKIEWAMELLYNSVKTGSQLVLETRPVGDKMQ